MAEDQANGQVQGARRVPASLIIYRLDRLDGALEKLDRKLEKRDGEFYARLNMLEADKRSGCPLHRELVEKVSGLETLRAKGVGAYLAVAGIVGALVTVAGLAIAILK